MPLYFFHLRSRSRYERDEEGLDCADLETAYMAACDAMPGLAADLLREGRNPMEHAFEVADAEGSPLLELPFTEMVRDGRRPVRPSTRALSQVERAHDLVTSMHQQIETLHKEMQASREWLADVHTASPR